KAFDEGGATAGNNIYVKPGTYTTNKQYGFDLQANLIGDAATRDEVIIQSGGVYRTLRMNSSAAPMVTNMTIIGESTQKADKGGAIEMNGGTLVDCVIKDGSVKNGSSNAEGGNLYVNNDNALVLNCEIFGGRATKRGGNIYLDKGTLRNCIIHSGTSSNVGGNIYQYSGKIENCTIYGGTATNDGGNIRMNGAGTLSDSYVYDGTVSAKDKKGANVYVDSSGKVSRCHLKGGVGESYNSGSLCVNSASASVEDTLIEGSACGGVLMAATSYLYNLTVVNNQKYGMWAWSATQHLYNCLIFGNTGDDGVTPKDWSGNQPNSSSAHFLNCATATGSMSLESYPTLVIISADDFANYAEGDYRLLENSSAVDQGGADPRGAAASATDLDGNPRMSGTIDIGCYEYQKQDMSVRIESAAYSCAWAPSVVTFVHASEHSASPENVAFTYDFGDGSTNETTSALSIQHAYANPGVYTVRITARNACEEESAEMTYEGYVHVASTHVYVNAGNANAAFPYDTPETGYAKLKDAISAAYDGYTLYLGAGVYESGDQTSISKALTLIGTGATPEDVIIRNTNGNPDTYYHRTLELNNAGASIANVTIENGCVKNHWGGNLRVAGGAIVSNCVIRGGLALASNGNAAGGAVVIGGQNSVLTHCIISNNVMQGTSNDKNYAGGTIFIEYGAKNAHLSNLLITGNRYVTTGDVKAGTAGIRFGGGNDWTTVENCTIAANTVEGAVADDSAGIYCTSWHCILRNNLVVGNVETEKAGGKCTSVQLGYDGGSNYQYKYNITDDVLIAGSSTKSVGNLWVADVNAIFRNYAAGDFTLLASGPAANAGSAEGLALSPAVDLAGNPREFGKAIDVGCFECQRNAGCTIIIR
ncbi:MAG: PKD domain-containing protein, partial [Kiritimatiellae bacterium]|nr:PKD domain-containing protein [Kiritimatiellia bacterium]